MTGREIHTSCLHFKLMISEWNQLIVSVKFAFGKVHLWVLLHKPAKQILFLLIFFYFKNEHICIHSCWMNKNNEYSELTEPHIPVLWEGSWCFTEEKKKETDRQSPKAS